MKLKYQKYLPKMIITEAMIEAFVDNDYAALHQLADLKPWEMSPTRCHTWKPPEGTTPKDFRTFPWFSSWWPMMALREKLQDLAAKEGIKPSRAAQLRKMRMTKEELAEQEGKFCPEIATEREPD